MDLSPRHARISMSPACNMSCEYCDGPKDRQQLWAMEDFRGSPLSAGIISTETYRKIISALQEVGVSGIAMTGGEPFLNKDWDKIADHAKEVWMKNVNITTNGLLLHSYLDNKWKIPDSVTLLNISLDTFDPEVFQRVTRTGNLARVTSWLRKLKECNPELPIRANKVWLRSTSGDLPEYIKECENLGVFRDVNLLSLIRKSHRDQEFVEREFISAEEIMAVLEKELGCTFATDAKYEFRSMSPGWLQIVVKDTNLTMRAPECEKCPMYCQEGFYTIRVATDWTMMTCWDYSAKTSPIPIIDAKKAIQNETLVDELREMVEVLKKSSLEKTLKKFFNFHKMNVPWYQ